MQELVDQMVQDHMDVVKIKADFISVRCPFHKSGSERHPSFWVSRLTGRWGCFTCGEGGTDLSTLLTALGISNSTVTALVSAAKKEWKKSADIEMVKREKRSRTDFTGAYTLPESLLGVWDWCPVQLLEAGFTQEVLQEHSIGYDKDRERITFPIRDFKGNLIGISGRATRPGEQPKYKVYEGWHESADGKRHPGELGDWVPGYSSKGIKDHLWRADVVFPEIYHGKEEQLIIVEGYKACLWMVQHGWTNTVALMGASMTAMQERLIRRMGAQTWILLDANDAGRRGTNKMCWKLGNASFPVYRCSYPEDYDDSVQPDDLSDTEIEQMLSGAERAVRKLI